MIKLRGLYLLLQIDYLLILLLYYMQTLRQSFNHHLRLLPYGLRFLFGLHQLVMFPSVKVIRGFVIGKGRYNTLSGFLIINVVYYVFSLPCHCGGRYHIVVVICINILLAHVDLHSDLHYVQDGTCLSHPLHQIVLGRVRYGLQSCDGIGLNLSSILVKLLTLLARRST